MNRRVRETLEASWPRTARETVAKLRNALRIKRRDDVFESERLLAWHTRQNITHRFANGEQIEIKITHNKRKP